MDKKTNIFKKIIKNLNHHKFGRCNICGKLSIFLLTTNINQARGDFICIHCRSYSRKRHVAKIINEIISDTSYISQITDRNKIDIFNLDIDDAFYKVLYGVDSFVCYDFLPNVELGTEIKKGVFCQDIERLTFPNESFDFVITEDVFEHVRKYKEGFTEISRVQKGGLSCFYYSI